MTDTATANEVAFGRLASARPVWLGVKPARDVVPGLQDNMLLHSGPPLRSRPQPLLHRALAGALLFERRADTFDHALTMISAGQITLSPGNDHRTTSPLAGVVSPSMPMIVVRSGDHEAYAPLNEGAGCVLRYGCVNDQVIANLHFLADELAPLLDHILANTGPLPVFDLVSRAVQMGDDCHHRFRALQMALMLELSERAEPAGTPTSGLQILRQAVLGNDFFALNLVMAAAKATALSAEGVAGSSLITVIGRNGTDTGIRISALPDQWFTAPVEPLNGVFIEGNTPDDANPDTGDSCIVEVVGLGAFALPAAPTLARWFGGSYESLVALSGEMVQITTGEHPLFTIPSLGFRGTPLGIDCQKVVSTGVTPITETLQTARTHRPGAVAIGISRVPMAAVKAALATLHAQTTPADQDDHDLD